MGDLEYQRQYGMELIESEILNIHGARESSINGIKEVQELVIATDSLPRDMWRKARAFSWMTAFLHFDKLIQIPLILMHEMVGASYREMIQSFIDADSTQFPQIAEIRDHFLDRAEIIQNDNFVIVS